MNSPNCYCQYAVCVDCNTTIPGGSAGFDCPACGASESLNDDMPKTTIVWEPSDA